MLRFRKPNSSTHGVLREVSLTAPFRARLQRDADGRLVVYLVDDQGRPSHAAEVAGRTPAALVAAARSTHEALGRILVELTARDDVAPHMNTSTVQRGLDLRRREELTDDGQLYLERSAFSGSKAWAARLRAVPFNFARRRDYDYVFLETGDRAQSRSGRTGHATYDLRSEPDGAYVAESVWRSGQPQRVYFRLEGGSVQETTDNIDTARAWMGLTTPLSEVAREASRAQAEVARAESEQLRLPALTAVSDKQRDYAERVRSDFVREFRKLPASERTLWGAVARVTSAKWWLDTGNVRNVSVPVILGYLMTGWMRDDPARAAEALGTAWALSYASDEGADFTPPIMLQRLRVKMAEMADMVAVEKILRRSLRGYPSGITLDAATLRAFAAAATETFRPRIAQLEAETEP